MRSTIFLAALLAASLLVVGCGPESAGLETRSYQLQHIEARSAFALIEPYVFTDHTEAPGTIRVAEATRALTVRERPANLDRIGAVLREHDRPAPAAALHFQVVEASPEDGPRSPELGELEDTLRDVFRFGSYRQVGEALVRVVAGENLNQRVSGPGAHLIQGTLWSVNRPQEGPPTGRLTISLWTDSGTRGLDTTVNVADGQTLVVGTAGNTSEGGALILTVRAEFEG